MVLNIVSNEEIYCSIIKHGKNIVFSNVITVLSYMLCIQIQELIFTLKK